MTEEAKEPTDSRPVMTSREAKWRVHVAGIRAAAAARKSGGEAGGMESLLEERHGGFRLAGYSLTYCGETVMLLEKLEQRYREAKEESGTGHFLFLLAEPTTAWTLLKTRRDFDLDEFEAVVAAFMKTLTSADIRRANEWFEEERRRIGQGAVEVERLGEEGAGAGSSPPSAAAVPAGS